MKDSLSFSFFLFLSLSFSLSKINKGLFTKAGRN
jgi:hypothetical protein